MGTRFRRNRGLPQWAQGEGNSAQERLSTGLRSTRTTARHAEVSDGGRPTAKGSVRVEKAHLTPGGKGLNGPGRR